MFVLLLVLIVRIQCKMFFKFRTKKLLLKIIVEGVYYNVNIIYIYITKLTIDFNSFSFNFKETFKIKAIKVRNLNRFLMEYLNLKGKSKVFH